jgi:tetratricopeptide (TPR) repeat protein
MRYLCTLLTFLFVATALPAAAQPKAAPNAAPRKAATVSTPADDAIIRDGVRLHDQEKYDEAIAKYQEVLAHSPANMTALYEMAFSYLAKKDYVKGRDAANRGTEYASDMLPMFYDLLGESYDAAGEPQKAIEQYERGIAAVPDASVLYHNMAITYLESLKNEGEARRSLKRGADVDPTDVDIQLMLGQVFRSGGYQTPALLAFSKALLFDPTNGRALQAIGWWRAILRGGLPATSGGQATAMASQTPASKTDEGDFSAIDRQFAIGQQAIVTAMDNGAGEMPTLLAQVNDIVTRLAALDPGKYKETFVGRQYLPYFAELKKRNDVEPFVYWILQRAPVTGVRDWLDKNKPRVQAFLEWTNQFPWDAR